MNKVNAVVHWHLDNAAIDGFIKQLTSLRKMKGKPSMTWYEKEDKKTKQKVRVPFQSGWDHPKVEFITSDGETKLVVWKIE